MYTILLGLLWIAAALVVTFVMGAVIDGMNPDSPNIKEGDEQ